MVRPVLLALGLVVASACHATEHRMNPFFEASTLPLQAPPFDRITDAHYQPALEEGMERHLAEVEEIAQSSEPPTFENTIVALERSGRLLERVIRAFYAITAANTNDALQTVEEEMAPKLAAHSDAIYLNDALFARVKASWEQRDVLALDPESHRLVEYYYHEFTHAGANLSDADKARLKELNEEEASLSTKFTNQLLEATKAGALVVDDRAQLAGLTDAELQAAAQAAEQRNMKGRWVLPLQNTTQQPALQSLQVRATRQTLFEASWNRAQRGDENDTRAVVQRLAELRADKARLLGHASFAGWTLVDQMAKTPETVQRFLSRLVPATTAKARREAADIQALIDAQGVRFALAPWDWNFYAEQVRKARYDLDEAEVKPYFELDRVLRDGVFYAAHELYGLDFAERHDLPVYHPSVRVFDVIDRDGSQLGIFYYDPFKRDNKSGGAWMDNFVTQSLLLGQKPVVFNVTNFSEPAPGQPALLSFDDVNTLFHEFGHALHGLFAAQRYPSISGANTARDFVEFPSQFNEHWALYPSVFEHYAVHHRTGQPMPKELVEKIKRARTFNQGYALTELLAAAQLDMQWHSLPPDAPMQDVDRFQAAALERTRLDLPQVPPRYRSSYFAHIWGGGYAAGYYAYIWTEMLSHDAYGWFEENGGLTRANGDRFREMILSRGNTLDYAEMFRAFRGRDPEIEAMLERRGLTQ